MNDNIKLISITQGAGDLIDKTAQEIIGYVTRVSNKKNQHNFETIPKLIKYCIDNQHWSPFEHAYMTVEITTTRAIAAQILRHRSFTFQEYSQRYSEAFDYEPQCARRQDVKNRQNSIDDLDDDTKQWFLDCQRQVWDLSHSLYEEALDKGISKESARFLLPLNTTTTLYMTGSARSWIHYIAVRTDPTTQYEHRVIADACKEIFNTQFPHISEALGWL